MSWGRALTHFTCKLRLKIFFTAPRGAGAPTAPLATPMLPAFTSRSTKSQTGCEKARAMARAGVE